ncbi:MAG: CBS and ACT domain-containing protein [Acidobacteriota bacterium]|nr:CBS and ACT domain-containing protein [Blastocatellia bacterium]MDW8238605.1 CBS and ACT domain-containing protein [Acidobacteriota bacterium]
MLVKQIMTQDVVTVAPNDTLWQADQLLMKGRFRHLPVVEAGRLVGIVSDRDIRIPLFLNSRETALQTMQQKQIRQIMRQPVMTASPLMAIEQAAAIMYENKIGCLPVLENDRLVGIITESDIFRAFIQIMGVMLPSSRLQLLLDDGPEPLAKVTHIVKDHGVNIVSLVTEPCQTAGKRIVVVRLQTIDPRPIISELQRAGIEISSPELLWRQS